MDRRKNENVATVDLEVLDGSPPVLEFREVTLESDNLISICFTCEDNREMGIVWVILIGENGDIFNISEGEKIGKDYIIRFNKKGLGNEFRYSIHGMDASGNVASTEERTFVLPREENGLGSVIWFIIFLIAILAVTGVTFGVAMILRSRSESRENQVDIMKIKKVFEYFKVGTKRNDMDCYKVLGVPQNAKNQEITRSYRELALVYHPDRTGNGATVDDAEMKRINCAKTILLDPEKRAILDRYLESK